MRCRKFKKKILSYTLALFLIITTTEQVYATTPENQVPSMSDYPTGQFLVVGDTGGYFLWTVPKSGVYRLVMQGGASSPSTRLDADPVTAIKGTDYIEEGTWPYYGRIKSLSNAFNSRLVFKRDPRIVRPPKGAAEVSLTRGQKLHVFVGGNGTFNVSNQAVIAQGGYNGGGNGNSPIDVRTNKRWATRTGSVEQGIIPNTIDYIQAGAGGGTTDIRLNADSSNPSLYLKHILMAAPSPVSYSVYSSHVPIEFKIMPGYGEEVRERTFYIKPGFISYGRDFNYNEVQVPHYGPMYYTDFNEANGKPVGGTSSSMHKSYVIDNDTLYGLQHAYGGEPATSAKHVPMNIGTLPGLQSDLKVEVAGSSMIESYLNVIDTTKYNGKVSTVVNKFGNGGLDLLNPASTPGIYKAASYFRANQFWDAGTFVNTVTYNVYFGGGG